MWTHISEKLLCIVIISSVQKCGLKLNGETEGKNKVPQNCVCVRVYFELSWATLICLYHHRLSFVACVIVVFVVDYDHLYFYVYCMRTHTRSTQFGIHTPFFKCVSHVLIMTKIRTNHKKIRWENSECNNNVYRLFLVFSFFFFFFSFFWVKRVRKLFACSVHFRLLSSDTYAHLHLFGPLLKCLFRRKILTYSNSNSNSSDNNGNGHKFI